MNLARYEKAADISHLGTDIFRSDAERNLGGRTGATANLNSYDFRVGYRINPTYNMNIVLGVIDRTERSAVAPTDRTRFIYAGFRTSLINAYYDF